MPPFCVQAPMHSSSARQVGLVRHVEAWAQQLVARQSPQAVPSDGHTGGPQSPLVHSPAQQLAAVAAVHAVPLALQAASHVPFEQVPEQQSENFTHEAPVPEHVVGPQIPWALQSLLQQGALTPPSAMQESPSARHTGGGPQTKLVLQSLLQHSLLSMQGVPSGSQVVGPQVP